MERYFRITPTSELYIDWSRNKASRSAVREVYKQFAATYGVEADVFYASDTALIIKPKGADNERFRESLCRPEDGMRKFKSHSRFTQAWVQALQENGVEVIDQPLPILYVKMEHKGKYSTRLFEVDGTLYCSFDGIKITEVPDGFVEMRANKFFKAIEKSERGVTI